MYKILDNIYFQILIILVLLVSCLICCTNKYCNCIKRQINNNTLSEIEMNTLEQDNLPA